MTRRPRPAVPAALLASLSIAVAGCGSDQPDGERERGSAGRSLACDQGRFVVGIAKARTGPAAFFDIAGTRGAKVAFDQINAQGGIKGCRITVIEGDTASDAAAGARLARELIAKGARMLLVSDDYNLGLAAARVGQKAGVLTLSTAASSTRFAGEVGDKFFNAGPTTSQLGEAQARFALGSGWRSTYVVVDEGLAYFTEQVETYRAVYGREGGTVAGTDEVDTLGGQADFGSVIARIRAARPRPEVVMVQMIFPNVGLFVKQLREAGLRTPVLGNVTLQTRQLPEVVGPAGSDAIYYAAQIYFEGANRDPRSDPAMDAFATEYQARFGMFPEQANGPGSYQALMAINQALQRKDVVDAGSAAAAIRAQQAVDVPGGTLVRWEDGHAIWNITIDGLERGRFRQIQVVPAT